MKILGKIALWFFVNLLVVFGFYLWCTQNNEMAINALVFYGCIRGSIMILGGFAIILSKKCEPSVIPDWINIAVDITIGFVFASKGCFVVATVYVIGMLLYFGGRIQLKKEFNAKGF